MSAIQMGQLMNERGIVALRGRSLGQKEFKSNWNLYVFDGGF